MLNGQAERNGTNISASAETSSNRLFQPGVDQTVRRW